MEDDIEQFANYALWFNLKTSHEDMIMRGFHEIYNSTIKDFHIVPERKFDFSDMFMQIGENMYLLRVPRGWSPGDVSGMFKHEYLDKDEEVMAILISKDSYLPAQGLMNVTREELYKWTSFFDEYQLVWN